MMFRTLFAIRRRVRQRTGKSFPSVGDSLGGWRHLWHSTEMKHERRLLIGLSCGLITSVLALTIFAS